MRALTKRGDTRTREVAWGAMATGATLSDLLKGGIPKTPQLIMES